MHPHRAFVCLLSLGGLFALSHAGVAEAQSWTEYRNERYGFSLSYPADLFVVERTAEAGDGQVFVATDADARLLVGALSNDSGYTPATYQDYIARHSYGQYQIGYRRLGKTWFVLSGEGGGKIFYEKVMFTCAGRLINSFAMIYPSDQRHLFDPVVERIEDTFRPARDCEGVVWSPSLVRGSEHRGGHRLAILANALLSPIVSPESVDRMSSSFFAEQVRHTTAKCCAGTYRAHSPQTECSGESECDATDHNTNVLCVRGQPWYAVTHLGVAIPPHSAAIAAAVVWATRKWPYASKMARIRERCLSAQLNLQAIHALEQCIKISTWRLFTSSTNPAHTTRMNASAFH